jgi:transposase
MNRYALRDDQWERIKGLLPGKPGDVGVTAHDNRRFVEAVLYRYRTGIPWRDLPERLGDWKNTHKRFSRWAKKGGLAQRQGSRRRWWLGNPGRVYETLRGKRS